MSTLHETVEHVLREREIAEKVAAAREEQREACARTLQPPDAPELAIEPIVSMARLVRLTPVHETPLADTIKDLRADRDTVVNVLTEMTKERDDLVIAVRERITENTALRDELEAEHELVKAHQEQMAKMAEQHVAVTADAKATVLRMGGLVGAALNLAEEPKPVCATCVDTHRMYLGDHNVPCTHCPTPCQKCRDGGLGAYCEKTPCACACHRPAEVKAP